MLKASSSQDPKLITVVTTIGDSYKSMRPISYINHSTMNPYKSNLIEKVEITPEKQKTYVENSSCVEMLTPVYPKDLSCN